MKKIALNFFGEEVAINIPKDLTSLRKEISEKFMFSPSDTAEIILTYIKDIEKKIIKTENDFLVFVSEKINKINLDISQDSKLYKENLESLLKENEKKTKQVIKLEIPVKKEKFLSRRDIEKRPLTDGINYRCHKYTKKTKLFAQKETEKKLKNLQQLQKMAKKLEIKLTPQEIQFITDYPKFSKNIIKQIEVWSNKIKELTQGLISSMTQKNTEYKNFISPIKKRINEKMQIQENFEIKGNSLKESEENIKKIIELKNEIYFSHRDVEEKPLINGFDNLCKKIIEKSKYLCENAIEKETQRVSMFKNKAVSMNIELNENENKFFNEYKSFGENIKKQVQMWNETVDDSTKKLINNIENILGEQKKIISVIKQKIIMKNSEKLKIIKNNENDDIKQVHKFVKCDGCKMEPITGCRFKCTVCDNFDYCENCEKKFCQNQQHQHPFLKINKPEMTPILIKCVLINENI